ncbi:CsbD family protein [Candidatus Odyssella thessalonicensis]|uniref:CsbD family protein n=1 Tax=Candidatus Odyssella thessalonicensis TaxID=84647 RepID=UPI000225B240|nr:CsbD family protein [Candidatus Odyssella thessalonicensis]
MNNNIIKGNINELKGSIQKRWGKITDQEFSSINGEKDKLVGLIQSKYGETKEYIEDYITEILNKSEGLIEDTLHTLKEKKEEAVDYSQQLAKDLSERVKDNPLPSVAISLGIGFLLGRLIK